MLLNLLGGSNYPAQFIQDSVLQVALAFTCQESNKNYKKEKEKRAKRHFNGNRIQRTSVPSQPMGFLVCFLK